MSILTLISYMKELGFLNLSGIMILLNSPSVVFVLFQHTKLSNQIRNNYVDKEVYKLDTKKLYEQIKELTAAISSLNITITRHDERLKLINKE